MRIAHLSTDPGVAYGGAKGASVHVAELTTALARMGAELLILVARVEPGAPPPPRGATVEALPGPGKGASTAERLAAEPERAAWLAERLERFGAEALYERIALHSAAGSTAAARLGIPHLVELNAPLVEEAARYRTLDEPLMAERLERSVLAGAELVLAVSGPLARYARGRGAGRVCVSANAVDLDRYPVPARQRTSRPTAVFAASLRPWHGIEVLAEAWRLLGAAAPPLTVVGDGPGRQLLEAAGAHAVGTLPHDRVPAALAAAQIGLVPYAGGAPPYFSPLKLFEYLAAGLAVVASAIPGVTEVVDERSAVLVPPGDPAALADAVAALAADPERRARLGSAARALAERHTWRRRAHRVLAAIAASPLREVRA